MQSFKSYLYLNEASKNQIHVGHPDDYTDDPWKWEVIIQGRKVLSSQRVGPFKLDNKTFKSIDAFVRALAKKYNVPENSFDLYSLDDNGKVEKMYSKGFKPRANVKESKSTTEAEKFEDVMESNTDPYTGRDAATRKGYTLYHKTYTDAINHALAHHALNGLTISDDTRDRYIAMGPRKPGKDKTVSLNLPAEQKNRRIHIQVYNRGGSKPYELNTYHS